MGNISKKAKYICTRAGARIPNTGKNAATEPKITCEVGKTYTLTDGQFLAARNKFRPSDGGGVASAEAKQAKENKDLKGKVGDLEKELAALKAKSDKKDK